MRKVKFLFVSSHKFDKIEMFFRHVDVCEAKVAFIFFGALLRMVNAFDICATRA